MLARPERAPGVRHLVVRAPNWVGDVVMATPVLEAAVASGIERVSVAIRSHLAPVLADGPLADHLIPFQGRDGEARALRESGADAALLFTNSPGAAWRAFRAGIGVRVGTALGGRGPLLTHRVAPPRADGRRVPAPTVHVYADLAGQLGIVPHNLDLVLHHRAELDQELHQRLEGHGLARDEGYVLCVPGAAFGAAKLWPPAHHAAALDALHEATGLRGLVTAPSITPHHAVCNIVLLTSVWHWGTHVDRQECIVVLLMQSQYEEAFASTKADRVLARPNNDDHDPEAIKERRRFRSPCWSMIHCVSAVSVPINGVGAGLVKSVPVVQVQGHVIGHVLHC